MLKKEAHAELKEEPIFKIDLKPKIPVFPEVPDENVNLKYPLIPPYAYAHIFWDSDN